jgi:predicted nucleic acid-binding protein
MYFLGQRFGWRGQQNLWRMIHAEELKIAQVENEMLDRMADLMDEYSDSPMDFADASLVAVAESQDIRRIFTLDSHFHAYRLRGGRKLEVVPKG